MSQGALRGPEYIRCPGFLPPDVSPPLPCVAQVSADTPARQKKVSNVTELAPLQMNGGSFPNLPGKGSRLGMQPVVPDEAVPPEHNGLLAVTAQEDLLPEFEEGTA